MAGTAEGLAGKSQAMQRFGISTNSFVRLRSFRFQHQQPSLAGYHLDKLVSLSEQRDKGKLYILQKPSQTHVAFKPVGILSAAN